MTMVRDGVYATASMISSFKGRKGGGEIGWDEIKKSALVRYMSMCVD